MHKLLVPGIVLASCLASFSRVAKAADNGPASPGPTDIIRIPIECEDMHGVKWGPEGFTPTWTAGRWGRDLHQNMVFGGAWASRMAAAVTDASDHPAEVYQDVTVPKAGRYKVWAKYECPPFFNYPFGIRIQPLGKDNAPQAAVFEKVFGLRESPKQFSFEKKLRTGDLYWSWGIDHDAAEGYETDLPEGRVRVTLYKAAAPAGAPVGARSVDAILITSRISELSAPEYTRFPLLDELQQANHVYVRFRNTGPEPVVVTWDHWNHRADHYYTIDPRLAALVRFYDASGKEIADAKGTPRSSRRGQWAEPIAPGEASPWIDVGPTVSPENSCPFYATVARPGKPKAGDAKDPASDLPLAMDVATEPKDSAVVKSFEKGKGEPELAVVIQPDLHRPEGRDWTLPLIDVYRRATAQLEQYPRVGPLPKKLRLYGGIGFSFPGSPLIPQRPDFPVSLDYAMALGLNTMPGEFQGKDAALMDAAEKYYADKGATLVEPSVHFHHTEDPAVLAKAFPDDKAKSRLYYNSFGDEIGLPHVNASDPKLLADFHEFLTRRGVKPADLGNSSMEEVKPLPAFSAAVAVQIGVLPKEGSTDGAGQQLPQGEAGKFLKRLYWHSNQFLIERGVRHFAERTAEMTRLIGPGSPQFKTTANLGGMHPFYWMPQSSFIESFRGGAMTLAWSEDYDYCQPEATRLVADFQAAYLRAGAKYHDTPMMFYCMPHYPGNTGQHVVQNAVLLWGQGVRDLDFFNAGPDGFTTENYIHSRGGPAETGRGIRQVSGMAGNVEDDLLAAKPRKARVAILLSEASDVWETEGKGQGAIEPGSVASNVSQEERKDIWYCLRNHGYLVDVLTENDVAEGRLQGYAALYVCGHNLDRRSARPIRDWIEAGGRLFLTAGAARRDEYDEPFTGLDAVAGRAEPAAGGEFYRGPLRAKMELLQLQPLGRAKVEGADKIFEFDAFASREAVTPTGGDAHVIGTYADGKPAMLRHQAGKGAAWYVGALPGQAYVRKALMPARPMGKGGPEWNFSQWEPVDYDPAAAGVILLPLEDGKIAPEATTSRRGVVANVAEGEGVTVITVVNLAKATGGKAKDVEIRLGELRPVRSARTAMKQRVEVAGGKTVKLAELDKADVIVIRH